MKKPSMDFDEQRDADMFKSANDGVRRALDESAAGEDLKKLALTGVAAFMAAAVGGFIVAAVAIKVMR